MAHGQTPEAEAAFSCDGCDSAQKRVHEETVKRPKFA
jgi:hypothetical protein